MILNNLHSSILIIQKTNFIQVITINSNFFWIFYLINFTGLQTEIFNKVKRLLVHFIIHLLKIK